MILICPAVLKPVNAEESLRQAGEPEDLRFKQPLIGYVMNGEHRAGTQKLTLHAIEGFQVCRYEPDLPVMAVNNIRGKVSMNAEFKRATGKENKALGIIPVITFGRAVEAAAVIKLIALDQVNGD